MARRKLPFGVFQSATGEPELVNSGVLFLDLLGMEAGACGDDRLSFLRRLQGALVTARADVGFEDGLQHVRALFSDSLIAAFPLIGGLQEEEVIGPAEVMAARLQLELINQGFFLRGALAFGEHYMDKDLAFGPALVEAAMLERSALVPRVVLSQAAADAERTAQQQLLSGVDALTRNYLLKDASDVTFISYLDVVLDVDDEAQAARTLERHREVTSEKLREFAGQPAIEAKYLWVARYHNYVCRNRVPQWKMGCDHMIDIDAEPTGLDCFVSAIPRALDPEAE